jgi:hypothetical protein
MKQILLISVGLFLILSNSFAQIISDDPEQRAIQWKVNGIDTLIYIKSDSDLFRQNSFILGWHWAGPEKFSHAVNANQQDVSLQMSLIID